MNHIDRMLEVIEYERDNKLILEFSNIGPKTHKFGVDVKLHLMQPDNKDKLKHGPRVKIFKTKPGFDFTITLEKVPRVIGDWKKLVSEKEKNILMQKIEHYREAFLKFWNDPGMTSDEFKDLMDEIDKKE